MIGELSAVGIKEKRYRTNSRITELAMSNLQPVLIALMAGITTPFF
ncbi:hypothetical protein [Candidatus Endomicrobiellum trichonymphae]|nr:hypothetical protein [Candidatus Endomicrobium trichonymphae]